MPIANCCLQIEVGIAAAGAKIPNSEWWLSAASVWELSIKSSLKRLVLPAPAVEHVADKVHAVLRILSVEWAHAAAAERLPLRAALPR